MKEEIAVSILVVFKLEEEAHSFKEMLKETYIYSMKPYGRNIFLHLFMPKRHLKKKCTDIVYKATNYIYNREKIN